MLIEKPEHGCPLQFSWQGNHSKPIETQKGDRFSSLVIGRSRPKYLLLAVAIMSPSYNSERDRLFIVANWSIALCLAVISSGDNVVQLYS